MTAADARPPTEAGSRLSRLSLSGLLSLLLAAACARVPAAPAGGPVVLVTLDALRADVVSGLRGETPAGGDPVLTPNLAALIRQADWSGCAVASSSWGVSAMASLLTGLSPWQHHALLADDARLADDLITLPKLFKALGYRTFGFAGGRWYTPELGYDRGFDSFDTAGRNREAAERLESLDDGKQLVWVHMPEPQAPWVRRDWLLPRLGGSWAAAASELPAVVSLQELEEHSDPAVPLPAGARRRYGSMYRLSVAWADEKVGRLLEAIRASGQWDNALVVVTSDYGLEMGEHGSIGHGGSLRRESIEVPLIVKLPSWYRRQLAPARGARVAQARLWATLAEAAGAEPPPAVAPSLFRAAPSSALSELYLAGGSNLFSLVEGDDQLLWETRFSPGLRAERRGGDELYKAFAATPPLTAGLPLCWQCPDPGMEAGQRRWTLERWDAQGGSRPLADRTRAAALARRLVARWREFLSDELTPEEEDREWIDQLPRPAPEPPPPAGGAPPG
jgi:Sulfatase